MAGASVELRLGLLAPRPGLRGAWLLSPPGFRPLWPSLFLGSLADFVVALASRTAVGLGLDQAAEELRLLSYKKQALS